VALKARITEADGLMIASPEYHHSVPGVLKNALDWAGRGADRVFMGKTAAVMAASVGPSGGFRSLPHLRQILSVLGVWLVPAQVTVAHAKEAFDASGQLKDETLRGQLEALVEALVSHTRPRPE
jgi:NAD(P)H-dependent FMN reductase